MASDFPEWVEPMAATLTQERFSGPEWIFERKLDGIRLLAFKRESDIRLLSRNRLPQHLPHIANAIGALPPRELILDGEMMWDGATYHVFDIMWIDGRDVMSLPLEERRALLADVPPRRPVQRVAASRGRPRAAPRRPAARPVARCRRAGGGEAVGARLPRRMGRRRRETPR